jgi:hypothetical protein
VPALFAGHDSLKSPTSPKWSNRNFDFPRTPRDFGIRYKRYEECGSPIGTGELMRGR